MPPNTCRSCHPLPGTAACSKPRWGCALRTKSDRLKTMPPPLHVFNGKQLSIARIRELSACSGVVDLAPEAWERVAASRAIVERHMAAGATIYGTNTGIGSQKDVGVAARDLAAFSNRMIISEATDFPGPPISDPAVRAALVVLINMVAGGRTGMRRALVERLLELYAAPRMPTVRADTAFGTAD